MSTFIKVKLLKKYSIFIKKSATPLKKLNKH